MPRQPRRKPALPRVELLEGREMLSTIPGVVENFDSTTAGQLPAGWLQWSSSTAAPFAVSSSLAWSAPNGLAIASLPSNATARAWVSAVQPADVQASAD